MAATGIDAPLWYRAIQNRRDAEADADLRESGNKKFTRDDVEALRRYKQQRAEQRREWSTK